jgi:hypothetical protein
MVGRGGVWAFIPVLTLGKFLERDVVLSVWIGRDERWRDHAGTQSMRCVVLGASGRLEVADRTCCFVRSFLCAGVRQRGWWSTGKGAGAAAPVGCWGCLQLACVNERDRERA